MIAPRWWKVLRDFSSNKIRTLLVVLSIAVGVFSIGIIAGSGVVLSQGMDASYQALQPADVIMQLDPFDADLVEAVRNMKEVEEAEGRRLISVRFKTDGADWRDLQLVALPDYEDIRINKVWPVSGQWPPAEREMLIERASIEWAQVAVGDTVLIETASGKQRALQISGVARDITQGDALLAGRAFAYVSMDTLDWLGIPRNFDQLYAVVAQNRGDRDYHQLVANRVRDKVEQSGRSVYFAFVPEPGRHPATDFLATMLTIMGGVGVLSLILSGFLVVNTISAILTQQIRQIGVMKTIGARTRQIVSMYMGTVVGFSLLALLVAVPLGALGAYTFAQFMTRLLNFDLPGFWIPPEALALEIGVGLLVPVLAALWPIFSGTRVSVQEAINAYGLGKGRYGANLIDRIIGGIRGLPRPLLLSLRNTFRRKVRLALTLLTLTLASTLFVVVFSVRASLMMTMEDALGFWNYDVMVEFSRPYRIDLVEREALNIAGVTAAESWVMAGVRRERPNGSESDSIQMMGLPPNTQVVRPTILEGRWILPEDENAIVVNTDLLRDNADIQIGDEITLKLQGRETRWQVVGVVRGVATGATIFANYRYMARVTGEVGRALRILLKTTNQESEFLNTTAKALETHMKARGIRVATTFTISTVRETIQVVFNVIIVFLMSMCILLGSVGGLGLMGTMSINVIERTREIGVMRAIGASTPAIMQIILVEGALIGIISWLLGTILAIPLSRILSDAVGQALFQTPLTYIFSVGGAVFWLLIVIFLAVLASFLPAWSASRLTVREVLAYE